MIIPRRIFSVAVLIGVPPLIWMDHPCDAWQTGGFRWVTTTPLGSEAFLGKVASSSSSSSRGNAVSRRNHRHHHQFESQSVTRVPVPSGSNTRLSATGTSGDGPDIQEVTQQAEEAIKAAEAVLEEPKEPPKVVTTPVKPVDPKVVAASKAYRQVSAEFRADGAAAALGGVVIGTALGIGMIVEYPIVTTSVDPIIPPVVGAAILGGAAYTLGTQDSKGGRIVRNVLGKPTKFVVKFVADSVVNAFKNTVRGIIAVPGQIADAAKRKVETTVQSVTDEITSIPRKVSDAALDAAEELKATPGRIAKSTRETVEKKVDETKQKLAQAVEEAKALPARKLDEITSLLEGEARNPDKPQPPKMPPPTSSFEEQVTKSVQKSPSIRIPTLQILPPPPQTPVKTETAKVEPKASAATQETPARPSTSFELPKVSIPKIDLSSIDVPKVEIPTFEIPKVEIPKIDVSKAVSTPPAEKPARKEAISETAMLINQVKAVAEKARREKEQSLNEVDDDLQKAKIAEKRRVDQEAKAAEKVREKKEADAKSREQLEKAKNLARIQEERRRKQEAEAAAEARAREQEEKAQNLARIQEERRKQQEAAQEARQRQKEERAAEQARLKEQRRQEQETRASEAAKRRAQEQAQMQRKVEERKKEDAISKVKPSTSFSLRPSFNILSPKTPTPPSQITKTEKPISQGVFGSVRVAPSDVAPRGVPTIVGWRKRRDNGINGRIYGSSYFEDGELVETSEIVFGEIANGNVVKTSSGSRYFLSTKVPAPNAKDAAKLNTARPGATITLTKVAKEKSEEQSNVLGTDSKPRPTFSLFGMMTEQTEKSVPEKPGFKRSAPVGVPTLRRWRRNTDGSVTGFISGSKSFKEGEKVTTSPIAKGKVGAEEIVTTGSGSRYFLE